ncbi:DUF3581 domain-containing protein [Shewanella marina]|uniref:DUF3581 domain-containing protein n=1 Tax=Shewanella marina TaxID=487319 RepID=UPI000472E6E0|nr:DUF3581 domain-containing protein [Shewanella marina]
MFLTNYYKKENEQVLVSAQQASDFAKQVASDFNPIHDVDAKRFCVPGDLLFALVLNKYGLSQQMQFNFAGMVGADIGLKFPELAEENITISDNRDKALLNVNRSGDVTHCQVQIEAFIRSYVAFSGLNFIHVLVPLMQEHQVMINPQRPLVIYESMAFELQCLDFTQAKLTLVETEFVNEGKRADVNLRFELHDGDKLIGTGKKTLVLSGLRPLEPESIDAMCAEYTARQQGTYQR